MAVAAVAILAVAKAMEDVCVRICVGTGVGIQIGIDISVIVVVALIGSSSGQGVAEPLTYYRTTPWLGRPARTDTRMLLCLTVRN